MSSETTASAVEKKPGFKNDNKPVWCPGCGDHSVLSALVTALTNLELAPENVAVISGIGCSARLPGYLSCYGFNSIHGRAIPIATGLKLSRPELTVVVPAGDGDCFAIGGGHVAHAVRRNVDLTLIVMDNGIYGLTKGQASPTTPIGTKTKTTAYGAYEMPFNPLEVMLAYGCTYVAQGFAGDVKYLSGLFLDAIKHPGLSFVDVVSPCPTYRGGMEQYKTLRAKQHILTPENHDASDWDAAHKLARDKSQMHVGVLYRERLASYQETQVDLRERAHKAKVPEVVDLANMYR